MFSGSMTRCFAVSQSERLLKLFLPNIIGPWEMGYTHELVIFKATSGIDIFSISCQIALRWMSQDLTDVNSTWVQQWAINWASVDPDLFRHMMSLGQ